MLIEPTKTRVYLVRHGETTWNRERRFQGQQDVPLSQLGVEQSGIVARWLAEQQASFAAVYSSDLARAVQTAGIIAATLGLEPVYAPALREIHVGEWQGLLVDEIRQRYPGQLEEWDRLVDRFTLPGGESIPQVRDRVFGFYNSIVTRHPGQAIVIVSHGACLAALIVAMLGWDLVTAWNTRLARMGNTGVSAIAFDHTTGGHELVLLNSTSHLAEPTGITSLSDYKAT
ncbi:MAG: histidine phosphatase family protein [Chloroflexota bacterium]|nr:histidine phosphatase family protein [Chloroflexota bacterium]